MRNLLVCMLLGCNSPDGESPGKTGDTGQDCPDSDTDGVCDAQDSCEDGDDRLDTDGDGVPDACDSCPGGDDALDSDRDGVCDALDACPDGDDALDADADEVPDACDTCAEGDDALDADTDGVPDACDTCPGGDDALDSDSDGVCDALDACPGSDDTLDQDGDTVPDGCDVCAEGDDTVDGDGDAIPDDCDECPEGDNIADADGDGIPDGCDSCPNGDPGTFQWVTWDTPISGDTATGSVGDTRVTYTSSSPLDTSTSLFSHGRFPASFGIPNANPTIRNSAVTDNVLSFDRPVVDPVLVFASIGRSSIAVTVQFDAPITVEWSDGLSGSTSTSVTGSEGYAVLTVPGVHEDSPFTYDTAEFYADFVFGFAGTTEDIDGDGQADFCDPCPEDPEDNCE